MAAAVRVFGLARDVVMLWDNAGGGRRRNWPGCIGGDERTRRRKLWDEDFDRLEQVTLSGELRASAPLPSERDLMERFGVGRPAIREAMRALGSPGLISSSHGERAHRGTHARIAVPPD